MQLYSIGMLCNKFIIVFFHHVSTRRLLIFSTNCLDTNFDQRTYFVFDFDPDFGYKYGKNIDTPVFSNICATFAVYVIIIHLSLYCCVAGTEIRIIDAIE